MKSRDDSPGKSSFRSRLDAIDGQLDSFLSNTSNSPYQKPNHVSEIRSQSPQRRYASLSAMRPLSPGDVKAAADEEVAHEATTHEKKLQQRLEVLQAHNEQMANQTEDLVQTVNLYQTQNRQLREELGQRDGWIRDTIQQLNPVDGDFASHDLRAGLSRWLQSVVKEAQERASSNLTVLDVRKAQAHADEMSTRERDVRTRLVDEANKSRIAQQFVSSAQVALANSHHRMSLTEAEVSLLRQQLQEALLSNQQAIQELTKTRGNARSLEGKVLVLEGQLRNVRAELREKEEELHSLHVEYNHRLVQLEEMRHDKTSLETQVQRVCGGLKHVVDELRSPSPHRRAQPRGRQEREREIGEVSARTERRWVDSVREEQGNLRKGEDLLTATDQHRVTRADLREFEEGDGDVQEDSEQDDEEQDDELYDDLGRTRRHGKDTRRGREEYGKKSRSSPSRVSFVFPTSPRVSTKSSQHHPPSEQRVAGTSSKRDSAEHWDKTGGNDAQQWLEMDEIEVEDLDTQLSSDVPLPEGDSAIAAAMLAPVGHQGPWRNPGVLWEDNGSAVDLQELHQNGKELSGFWLRRALKALGHGNSIALSVVDAQVQRQILLGVSSRGSPNCTIVSLPLHATVIKQGQTSQHMLVVLQGRIKIWRSERSASGRGDGGEASTHDASQKEGEGRLGNELEHDHDTVFTECVGEVSEGGVLLEVEGALGLSSPYTAMVATSSSPARAGGGGGGARKKRDTDQHLCEVLSVTGEALAALIDLYPSLHISERLVLSRKAFPYPGRALCISTDLSDDTSWSPQDLADLAPPPPFPDEEEPRWRSPTGKVEGTESRRGKMGGGTVRERAWRERDQEMEREMEREQERDRELEELKNRAWLVAADLSDVIQ